MAGIRAFVGVLFVAGACFIRHGAGTGRADTSPAGRCHAGAFHAAARHHQITSGFSIELYASDVRNARSMVLSPNGTLFVGSRVIGVGNVYAIVDRNKDNKADEVIVIAKGLNMPNGLAFRNGSLFVADTTRLLRYDNIEAQLNNPPAPVVLYENFPNLRLHQWHFIAFGPDGLLYRADRIALHRLLRSDRHRIQESGRRPDPCGQALREHHADEAGRHGTGNLRERHPQYGGIRLAPGDERIMVHRQRPRRDGRGDSTRRVEPCPAERTALRISLLPRRDDPGSAGPARRAVSSSRRRRISDRMSPHWECASIQVRSSRLITKSNHLRGTRLDSRLSVPSFHGSVSA